MASPQIKFGTDGWRGIIADDFTFQNLRYAAQGIANYLRRRAGPAPAASAAVAPTAPTAAL